MCAQLAFSQKRSNVSLDVSDQIVRPKHLIVPKAFDTVIIDGIAESVWDNAPFTSEFIDIEGEKEVKYKTKAKILWDDEFLYIYAELQEPHIWGDITDRDAVIYYNNDFEVFIDPSGKGEVYGEIELNALNTVWDLLLNKPYRSGGFANFHWNLDNLRTAVKVYGTINNSSKKDNKWTVEMAIPMRPLIELKNDQRKAIHEGDQWRLNFSRVEWEHDINFSGYSRKKVNGKYLPEYNWVWSNQNVINMHEPEKWGIVQFTNESTSKGIQFIQDVQLKTKQVAFALFRQTRFGELTYLLDEDMGFSQNIVVTLSQDEKYEATFYKTNFGFEYKMICPNSGSQFIINESGSLKINE